MEVLPFGLFLKASMMNLQNDVNPDLTIGWQPTILQFGCQYNVKV